MSEKKEKIEKICCIEDFEKLFYPKHSKQESFETLDNPKVLGAKLAQRSLKKVRYQLSKAN